MLIDAFAENWFDTLCQRAAELPPSRRMYLLLDGAFVPGLHTRLRKECKAILFEELPGCTKEAEDVSPFLTPFERHEAVLKRLLKSCNRWPMVSAIETPESLEQLAARLSVWCLVDAAGQRFNFRFPDTRRLSHIFEMLSPEQRAQISGPANYWSYIGRNGRWHGFELPGYDTSIAAAPTLDESQFSLLVSDSAADEMLVLLADRGMKVFQHPSRSHALLVVALQTAQTVKLPDDELLDWCVWYWRQDCLHDSSDSLSMLQAWRTKRSRRN